MTVIVAKADRAAVADKVKVKVKVAVAAKVKVKGMEMAVPAKAWGLDLSKKMKQVVSSRVCAARLVEARRWSLATPMDRILLVARRLKLSN